MPDHIVTAFDVDLKNLMTRISEMGGRAEGMVADSIIALARMDTELAQEVIDRDYTIDLLQREIDEAAILTIAKRQPMAEDLRVTISSIRISNDIERVGDLAKNIARRVIAMDNPTINQRLLNGIERMAELSLAQVKNVLDALTTRDPELARAVWSRDDEIDDLYTSLFRELLTYMMEDPRNISFCTHLLFCAKNLERIGDHATNVAETVIYMVTGQSIIEQRNKGGNGNVPLVGEAGNDA
ncbi:MAG: phosphate signaling complex protein PhoU [Pseudomonadota bacterium]